MQRNKKQVAESQLQEQSVEVKKNKTVKKSINKKPQHVEDVEQNVTRLVPIKSGTVKEYYQYNRYQKKYADLLKKQYALRCKKMLTEEQEQQLLQLQSEIAELKALITVLSAKYEKI